MPNVACSFSISRPFRLTPRSDYCIKNRQAKAAVAAHSPGVKIARKHDMLEGANRFDESSADDTSDEYDESTSAPFPGDTTVMYSFDAPSGPTRDTEILNVALAKAVQRFEERETVSLVKNEYDVLDSEGEVVAMSPVKKGKGASGKADSRPVMISDADEDYEFV